MGLRQIKCFLHSIDDLLELVATEVVEADIFNGFKTGCVIHGPQAQKQILREQAGIHPLAPGATAAEAKGMIGGMDCR